MVVDRHLDLSLEVVDQQLLHTVLECDHIKRVRAETCAVPTASRHASLAALNPCMTVWTKQHPACVHNRQAYGGIMGASILKSSLTQSGGEAGVLCCRHLKHHMCITQFRWEPLVAWIGSCKGLYLGHVAICVAWPLWPSAIFAPPLHRS